MTQPIDDIIAADKFVESIEARADARNPFPLWHGWALREAYFAGLKAGREELWLSRGQASRWENRAVAEMAKRTEK